MSRTFTIEPDGPFDLAEAAGFRLGHRDVGEPRPYDGVLRLAFCTDDYTGQAAVALRQDEAGTVHATVQGRSASAAIRRQVARTLSLDHDARAFARVLRRDPALAALHRSAPGLRPVLFASPYEAAVWSILTVHRARRQAAVLYDRLARTHGEVFSVAGAEVVTLPTPAVLAGVRELPSLPERWLAWLRGVAGAALDGRLDADTLAAADPDQAVAELRRIPGIGPFYATLILSRSTGATDILPIAEPGALEIAGRLYGRSGPLTQQEYERRAEAWRPWRTWGSALMHALLSEPRPAKSRSRRAA
jgi:DNA-3-methyladenine glycosylase II